jgi:hypothetical protein
MPIFVDVVHELREQVPFSVRLLPDVIDVRNVDQFIPRAGMGDIDEPRSSMSNPSVSPPVRGELPDGNTIPFRRVENDAEVLFALIAVYGSNVDSIEEASLTQRVLDPDPLSTVRRNDPDLRFV